MTYTYTAAGADGKPVTGELSAADKSAAIARLKERDLIPLSLTAKDKGNSGQREHLGEGTVRRGYL